MVVVVEIMVAQARTAMPQSAPIVVSNCPVVDIKMRVPAPKSNHKMKCECIIRQPRLIFRRRFFDFAIRRKLGSPLFLKAMRFQLSLE